MTMYNARLMQAVLRSDLLGFLQKAFQELEPGTAFLPNWHYQHLAYKLGQVANGEVKRLIINVPPRSGKSLLASVTWPMFLIGHDPTKRVICVSHTESLAREFSLNRRSIATSSWYRQLFPSMQLNSPRPRDLELRTTEHGYVFAAGVGGAVHGRGAELIIVDDPIKGLAALSRAERRRVAEFFDTSLITRLNDKRTGAIVIIMQRLHEDDLVGHVLSRDDWEVVSLPALAPQLERYALSGHGGHVYERVSGEELHIEREPRTVLEQVRRAQGSLIFEAQYQQRPTPAGGAAVKRDWLRWYDEAPSAFDRVVVSWDTASTLGENSDYSVGTVWGAVSTDYYLLDLVREKLEAPELRRRIVVLSELHRATATVIESTELGRALVQDLRYSESIRPLLIPPMFDKEARLLAQSARFESGQVHLPRNAPWLGAYVDELLAFPNGAHDDQVDSTSQALSYLTGRAPRPAPPPYQQPVRRHAVRRHIGDGRP